MKIILDETGSSRETGIRVDLAWQLFFESKNTIPEGHGGRLLPFTNWLWDELGRKAGYLNKNAKTDVTINIPSGLQKAAIDFLLRIVSFWTDEVHVKKAGSTGLSENMWKKPVVNVFDDAMLDESEKQMSRKNDDESYERFSMPLLGPGRSFFRVEVIPNGESAARYHSHSEVDEYYLILDGSGTLRYNGKDVSVKRGDLIGKPTGPDAVSQLIADRGEPLRILDMEVWHDRPYNSKDLVLNPDFNEVMMRGPGWGGLIPAESFLSSEDFRTYYDEGYKRTKDGGWTPMKLRGHKKVREKK